jgi:hypothetical protein
MADETAAAPEPVATPPAMSPLDMLTRPSLRLSQRQKAILGLCATPAPPTEKQQIRNKAAGERLKKFHQDRKTRREADEKTATRQLEEAAKVVVVQPPKKPKVSVKRKLVVEPSVESEPSSDSESDEPVHIKSKIHKKEHSDPPAPINPYYLLLSKRS